MSYVAPPVVVGLGELLWDVAADGRRPGGAPANFACHAAQLGAEAWAVSAVGDDDDGAELVRALQARGARACVAVVPGAATGRVDVALGRDGEPRYRIAARSAWDRLPWTEALAAVAARADALCFGSLAQRHPDSRDTVRRVLAAAPAGALKMFDVNLRAPHDDRRVVESSLALADLVKVNEAEWEQLARWFDLAGSFERAARTLSARFTLRGVLRTRGARGADAVLLGDRFVAPPAAARLVDSVGAGDAFAAACCVGLRAGAAPERVLALAVQVAGFVCTRTGGAPPLPTELRDAARAVCAPKP